MNGKTLIVFLLIGFFSKGFASSYCSEIFAKSELITTEELASLIFTTPSKRDLMVTAKNLYDQGQYSDAVNMLKMILQQDPDDYIAMGLYSRILYRAGEQKKLEQAYLLQRRVLELEPHFREASALSMAQILASLGRSDEAITYLRMVLGRNPEHVGALGILARQYLNLGKLREARDIIEEKGRIAEESGIRDPYYLGLSAEVNSKLGNHQAAMKRANQLINEYRPRKGQRRVPKHFIMGLILKAKLLASDLHRLSEAHQLLDEAETHLGFFSWFEFLRAEIYFREGRVIESKASLVRILRESTHKELGTIAALVRIEESMDSQNALLSELFKHLSEEEVLKVMTIYRSLNWEINSAATEEGEVRSDVHNDFWSNLYTIPIDSQARGR